MSVYGKRDEPAYGPWRANPDFAQNLHILKWWTAAHDNALKDAILFWRWAYGWKLSASLQSITPDADLEAWRASDPKCADYAWYNVLMYFGIARAHQLGFEALILPSQVKCCVLCRQPFREDSLPQPLIERLTPHRVDACSPCLVKFAVPGSGRQGGTKADIIGYLQRLADALGRVPAQSFGEVVGDLCDLTDDERLAVYPILSRKISSKQIKRVFGSYLAAASEAGLLEGGRRTARGIQSISKCGHSCLSLGEKTICEALLQLGMEHTREPPYPEGRWRADWRVGDILVEYLGLAGTPEYDAKLKIKREIAARHQLNVLYLLPKDLLSTSQLREKLLKLRRGEVG